MTAPKKFGENPTEATELLKNGTEKIGLDQNGVAKKIAAETLMTKANVGLGNVDNVSDADKPVSDAQDLINDEIKGVGWTDETVKDNADAIATLEADVNTAGSVLKSIKDNSEGAVFTPVGGIDAVTIGGALEELDTKKAVKDDIVDDFIGGLGKIASANDAKELYELIDTRVYGLDINETTGANTRLLDAVGMTVTAPDGTKAITSSFDSVYPWSEMKHVKVSVAGVKILQTDAGYDAFDGELMTRIPEFWYKDYRSGGHRYLYISRKKRLGFKQKAEQLIASMPASKVGSEYRSRVGEAPETNISYTNFITGMYAQGDSEWSMYDSNTMHSIFMLSTIEGGSLNYKGMYGQGINSGMPYGSGASYEAVAISTDGNTITIPDTLTNFHVGMTVQIGTSYTNNSIAQNRLITDVTDNGDGTQTITIDGAVFNIAIGNTIVSWGQSVPQTIFDTIGDGSGYIEQYSSANMSHVAYRGIWDLWGNVWQFNAGFMRYDGRYYGCADPTKYNITDPRGADGWVDLGIGDYAANGYQQIREGIEVEGGMIDVPILWGAVAGSVTFYSAYLYYFDSARTGTRVLRFGGYWLNGTGVSLVCSNGIYSPSISNISYGSRLIRS